jgi:hypothetical protein
MAIIWTASSDAARQACGKAAARWGNAQAVTESRDRDRGAQLTGGGSRPGSQSDSGKGIC